ncbi:MAG: aldo/keto reductase [Clostridia bacterium]|nr:aldo/keto reductase [Clostridia bacterium]
MLQKKPFLNMEITSPVFGCDSVGHRLSDEVSYQLLDYYVEKGGNFLDTARLYCAEKSEGFIARYLKDRNLKGKMFVATKAGHPLLSDMHKGRLSKQELSFDINTSLKELQTDCIDLLYLHRDDTSLSVGEIVETMNEFIKEGKIRNWAVSNWKGSRIKEANDYAEKHGLSPIVASSILYNIARHNGHPDDTLVLMDETEFEFYKESQLPLFAYSSQAKGFFNKFLQGEIPNGTQREYLNEENKAIALELKALSGQTGKTVMQLSLERLQQQSPFPVFPIVGASTINQLKEIF